MCVRMEKTWMARIADYNRAIEIDPKYASAYNNRGLAKNEKGDVDGAVADYNLAIQLDANDVNAWTNLEATSKKTRAISMAPSSHYDRAVQINPKKANTYYQRGWAREKKGDANGAVADYTHTIELDPKNAHAYNTLAWLLATCAQDRIRDGKKAVAYASKACEMADWKEPDFLDTLAAACAETGDFAQAVKWEAKILETPNLPEKDAATYKSHLALYQLGKAYH